MSAVTCIRCEAAIPFDNMDETCPRAPDHGPHEGIAPPEHRRRGWSLHVADCPSAQPVLMGRELVDCACTCRAATRRRGRA